MAWSRFLPVVATLTLIAGPAVAETINEARAIANYQRILRGEIQPENLTLHERREIVEVDRRLRELQVARGNSREQCIADEIEHEGGSVTYLQSRIIDLKCSQR